jgi:hypothetical protein
MRGRQVASSEEAGAAPQVEVAARSGSGTAHAETDRGTGAPGGFLGWTSTPIGAVEEGALLDISRAKVGR